MTLHVGPGRVYIARANTPPPAVDREWREDPPPAEPRPIRWVDVGGITAGSMTFADLDDGVLYEAVPALTGHTFTASFTGRVTPKLFRLLAGFPYLNRHRVRTVTRRKYRARARRKG